MSHILNTIKLKFSDYREIFSYYVIDEFLKNCGYHIEIKPSASGIYTKLCDAEIIFTFLSLYYLPLPKSHYYIYQV